VVRVESLREAFRRAGRAHRKSADVHERTAALLRSRGDEERADREERLAESARARADRLNYAAESTAS
jgi:hypothetical protein